MVLLSCKLEDKNEIPVSLPSSTFIDTCNYKYFKKIDNVNIVDKISDSTTLITYSDTTYCKTFNNGRLKCYSVSSIYENYLKLQVKYLVEKYDSVGILEWKTSINSSASIIRIVQLKSSDYLLGGISYQDTAYQHLYKSNIYLAKIGNNGKLLWSKTYEFNTKANEYDKVKDIIECPNNTCKLFVTGYYQGYFANIDSLGNLIWKSKISYSYNQIYYYNTLILHNNKYYLAYSSLGNIYFLCLNENGETLWHQKYTGNKVIKLLRTSSSDFYLIGTYNYNNGYDGSENKYKLTIKTDSLGKSCF